jgi:hypothetical protein
MLDIGMDHGFDQGGHGVHNHLGCLVLIDKLHFLNDNQKTLGTVLNDQRGVYQIGSMAFYLANHEKGVHFHFHMEEEQGFAQIGIKEWPYKGTDHRVLKLDEGFIVDMIVHEIIKIGLGLIILISI